MAKPKRRSTGTPNPSFSPSEIEKMEKLAMENKGEVLNESFYKNLTEDLNVSSGRTESEALQTEQVQAWFESKRKCQPTEGVSSLTTSKEQVPSDISLSNDEPEILNLPKDTEEKAPKVADLEFEAKSSRDQAWYDVEMFVNHRFVNSGELEVRVRFKDYGAEDDEWLNVKKAVRGRSIPLEKGDCAKVSAGDTVLCFRESSDQAMYYDAYVTNVERRPHDMRGCRCLFSVRYVHDQSEELVTARKVCRRATITVNM